MDASTKALFTVKENIGVYHIFKSIEYSASTQKSYAELKLLYIQCMSIKLNNNESIRAFVERLQTYTAQFDGTDYEVKPKSLAHRWHKGLGSDFHSINKMVDKTGIIPDVWSKKLTLRQLVNKSESYLRAKGLKDAYNKKKDEKNKTEEKLARLRNIRSRISKAMA